MDYVFINVRMELFGALVSGILFVYQLLTRDENVRAHRLLTISIGLHIAILLGDALLWELDGVPGTAIHFLQVIGNPLLDCLAFANLAVLTTYLYKIIRPGSRLPRSAIVLITLWLTAAAIILTISQFNGMFYYVDSNNVYHLGPHYRVLIIIAMLSLVLFNAAALLNRKSLNFGIVVASIAYGLIPLFALALQWFYPELTIIYMSYTITYLILFVTVRMQNETLLKQKEIEALESQISIMVSQIQPHFLYNALSVLSDLTERDPRQAQEAIWEFSDYLRGNLDSLSHKEPVPFVEELEHTELYLSMEKRRFGNRLNIEFEIEVEDFKLPVLSLQPLVENAVMHGVTMREEGGTVRVHTYATDNFWVISVEDNGVGFNVDVSPEEEREIHQGIANVRHRLKTLSHATLKIESKLDLGTRVQIHIPR